MTDPRQSRQIQSKPRVIARAESLSAPVVLSGLILLVIVVLIARAAGGM